MGYYVLHHNTDYGDNLFLFVFDFTLLPVLGVPKFSRKFLRTFLTIKYPTIKLILINTRNTVYTIAIGASFRKYPKITLVRTIPNAVISM